MGLRLKGTPIASKATQERAQKAMDVLADVQAEVEKMGLPPYPKPKTLPDPLSDIEVGSLSNRELETQMAAYIAYAAYVGTKLAEADVAYRAATSNLKAVQASLEVDLFKDRVPKNEIRARVKVAPEFVDRELEQLKMFAIKTILEAHHKSYSTSAQTLSRSIETRKLEYEQALREHNAASFKPRPQRGGLPTAVRQRQVKP